MGIVGVVIRRARRPDRRLLGAPSGLGRRLSHHAAGLVGGAVGGMVAGAVVGGAVVGGAVVEDEHVAPPIRVITVPRFTM